MSGTRREPARSQADRGRARASAEETAGRRTGPASRYADWRLERQRKADGRYLLYYSWPAADREEAGEPGDV